MLAEVLRQDFAMLRAAVTFPSLIWALFTPRWLERFLESASGLRRSLPAALLA